MPLKAKVVSPIKGNRTDTQQPIQVPTGMPYGDAQDMRADEQAAPLPASPTAPAAAAPTPAAGAGGGAGGNPFAAALDAMQASSVGPVNIHGPSDRPGEPLTAGMAIGPGPGPEVLAAPPSQDSLAQMLAGIAQRSGSSDLTALATMARRLGQ